MAFFGGGGGGGGSTQINQGNDLKDIQTDKLGFKALAGEKKLKFLPSPWPNDSLPSPTSSLLSVASGKGLVAAAGPDTLVVASTDAVRNAFTSGGGATNNIQDFTPQAKIPVPRVSQVAFSSDESSLVICADSGGGLAVYDVQAILNGGQDSAFQLATHGVGVRALVANPAKDAAHLFAIVLSNGNLLMADLKQRQLLPGRNGPVLKEGVSCVAWSAKGKQLVAGLGNGTAVQMTPTGEEKALIPKPPSVGNGHHISTIYWLANDDWLIWHTPSNNDDPDRAPDSTLHLAHREKGTSNFSFHKLTNPCGPFGLNRSPPHFFVQRIRDYPPDLNDMLIVASSASDEINLLTRSAAPLSNNEPANEITNTFTMTSMENDTDRAQLPIPSTDDMDGPTATSPIGLALDLSSKDKVPKPILAEEMDESASPLPALYVLNNEGIMCAWWVIYKDSIRKGTIYPGLTVAGGHESALSTSTSGPSSAFGRSVTSPQQANFGSPFGKPTGQSSTFGQSGFPSAGSGSAFGGASAMGAKASPWGAGSTSTATGASAFGQPAFGSATSFGKPAFGSASTFGGAANSAAGSAFGASSTISQRQSPWGAPQPAKSDEAAKPNPFASSSGAAASPFAAIGNKPAGFAGFAQNASGGSGFAALGGASAGQSAFASPSQPKQSPFATLTPSNSGAGTSFTMSGFSNQPSFGSTVSIGSSMGASPFTSVHAQGQSSAFGQKPNAVSPSKEEEMGDEKAETKGETPQKETPKSAFGLGTGGFQLGSTFKDTAKKDDDGEKDKDKDVGKTFTSGLGGALFGEASKPAEPATPIKQSDSAQLTPKVSAISTTPATAPKQPESSSTPVGPSKTPVAKPVDSQNKDDIDKLPTLPGDDENELPPLAGSPPIKVEAPSSPLSEEGEIEDDAPLPPDPQTVAKPSWFNQPIPGARSSAAEPQPTPKAAAPLPPTAPMSKPGDGGFGLFSNLPQLPKNQSSFPDLSKQKPVAQEHVERTPARQPFGMSHTPAGLPKQPVFPPPTSKLRSGSRSPSPIRSASSPVGHPLSVPPARPVSRPTSRLGMKPVPQPPPQEEEPDIEDVEAERVQAELQAPLVATKELDEFIAHQDYAGAVTKSGIPGQIERVFRDINSMVDTLGLNARSLAEFIKGHKELLSENGRSEADLEDPERDGDWALDEIEDLQLMQTGIERSLDDARIKNVDGMLAELDTVVTEVSGARRKALELKKQIIAFKDPAKAQKMRDAPLPAKKNTQLSSLRTEFAKFQKQLAEAEECVVLLKAKLASAPAVGGKGPKKQQAPTAEAVTNTIRKMTAMVEKKSGDIDVLEAQMRKLGLSSSSMSSSMNGSRMSASFTPGRSREGTPFATPTGGAKGMTYGFGYGSESGIRSSPLRGSELILRDDDDESVERLVDLTARRKKVLQLVGKSLKKRGRIITEVK